MLNYDDGSANLVCKVQPKSWKFRDGNDEPDEV